MGGGLLGGIRKKRNEAVCGNPRRLVVRAVGTSHSKEVGIGGTIRAPSLLVIAKSPGKRPRCPLAHPRHPPAHPPLLTAAPIPLSLQLQTTKANQLSISGTRFFGENLTADLKPDRQKELKNGVFMLFPRILAAPNF